MPEDKPKACHRCEGSGEVVHPADIHKHPNDPDLRIVTCPRCFGTGER